MAGKGKKKPKKQAKQKSMFSRSYTDRDLKLLFGLSGMKCALPTCRKECHVPGQAGNKAVIVGQIAHIVAFSDDGPRADPTMPVADRNKYENLMLLCGGCNTTVDTQPNLYTVARLHVIKADHEKWVRESLTEAMQQLSHAELEIVTKHILKTPQNVKSSFTALLAPSEKLKKNALTWQVQDLLTIGLLKAPEVEEFLKAMQQIVPTFPDDLREVFVREYRRLLVAGLTADALFFQLHDFASRGSNDYNFRTAALAIISHFFLTCDIFET